MCTQQELGNENWPLQRKQWINLMAREEAFSLVYSNALDNEGASLLPGDINDTQILLDPVLGAIDKVGQRWK